MARDPRTTSNPKLTVNTHAIPSGAASASDLKVAVVDPPAPTLDDILEGEILELSADDADDGMSDSSPGVLAGRAMADMTLSSSPIPETEPRSTPRGRSLLQVSVEDQSSSGRSRNRSQSESARQSYDSVHGERISRTSHAIDPHIYRRGQPRYPLLQDTVDELACAPSPDLNAIPTSTGPSSTAPQTIPEHSVPSPTTVFSPSSFPTLSNIGGTLPSPSLRRSASGIPRPASNSQRNSRRSSARSGSSATSPAGSWLSMYRGEQAAKPEPDAEGQQIGDEGEYVIGQQIGFGGFSVIKEVFKVEAGVTVHEAVKIVHKRATGKSVLENERFQREVEHEEAIWRHLHHPHVLPLRSVFDTSFAKFFIMPLTPGGTLLDLVRRYRQRLPGLLIKQFITHVASAVHHLHRDARVVHRDIKLENCLLDKSWHHLDETGDLVDKDGKALASPPNVLVCDFGMADFYDRKDRDSSPEWPGSDSDSDRPQSGFGPSETSTSVTGSLPSASPELIRANGPLYEPAVDMWAFGVLCHTLLAGRPPFYHEWAPTLQMMILKGDFDREGVRKSMEARGEAEDEIKAATELVSGCMEVDVRRRFTIAQALQCRYLQGEERVRE